MTTATRTATTMLDDFLIRAGLAALGTAFAAAGLGCFVVWRRMAYLGDATAHAAILGVAISLAFGASVVLGVAAIAGLMALLFFGLQGRGLAADTLLGVLAHGALALGLVAAALIPAARVNLDAYLFGDVLTVSKTDISVIWAGAGIVGAILWWRWSALLTSTLSPDLAYAAGLDPRREELLLTLSLALVVAVAIKVVGALLITALLIIPAAAARGFARTPEGMAALAVAFGGIAAIGGLRTAVLLNTPVGPTIVCVATTFFALSTIAGKLRNLGG